MMILFKNLYGLYAISEAFVMLMNNRRRAIHDFIGGTIVICKYKNAQEYRLSQLKHLSKTDKATMRLRRSRCFISLE